MCDIAFLQENDIAEKLKEKQDKHQQLAFEKRQNRVDYRVEVALLAVGYLDGGL